MSDFLKNLKEAADKGEFNSDAAKKIIEISELADKKVGGGTPEELKKIQEGLEERQKEFDSKNPVTEESVIAANTEYEKKMEQLRIADTVNKQVATLIDIDDMVVKSIEDMQDFMRELDRKFEKEFESNNPQFDTLKNQMDTIKKKYDSIIKYDKNINH